MSRVVGYARNPDKTEYEDVAKVIRYATGTGKVETVDGTERRLLVTSLNCDGDPADAMLAVQRAFHKEDGNVAYHAYQSFAPGEVTPEQCHEIGVRLAREQWGKNYQVVVATHMDKPTHLHNHFVINSVSFRTGKKFDCSERTYWQLRNKSDELCREYGLSVIEKTSGRTPRVIYQAEKDKLATRYSLMRDAVDNALRLSTSYEEFTQHLWNQGYVFDRNEGRKHPTIKRKNEDKKPTRLYHLGEQYSLRMIDTVIMRNHQRNPFHDYEDYVVYRKVDNGHYTPDPVEVYLRKMEEEPSLLMFVLLFLRLLGGPDLLTPERHYEPYTPVTPEMKENRRWLESISRQANIMVQEGIETKEDVDAYLDRTERRLNELARKRKDLYNSIRRCTDDYKIASVKPDIYDISAEMTKLRRSRKDMENLLLRSGVMAEMIEAEKKARIDMIAREYQLTPEDRDRLHLPQPPEQDESGLEAEWLEEDVPARTQYAQPVKPPQEVHRPGPIPCDSRTPYPNATAQPRRISVFKEIERKQREREEEARRRRARSRDER